MQRNPRTRRSRRYVTLAITTVLALFVGMTGSAEALGTLSDPQLSERRYIKTSPFGFNSGVSVGDVEGMAYVGSDDLLWISDDNDEKLYAVDRSNGALIQTLDEDDFTAVGATETNFEDLEALAWNNNNALFAFSGNCCPGTPSVFKIKRDGYRDFRVDSYNVLPGGSDFSGAAIGPGNRLWVGNDKQLRRYYYSTNSFGTTIDLPIPSGKIQGMGFSDDGNDLFVVTNNEVLYRFDWDSLSIVDCYDFDLTGYGIEDARAVDLISDVLYVLDGGDSRPQGDPRRHAIVAFDVVGGGDSSCSGGGGGGGGGNSVTVNPTDDAFINSAKPDKNFGDYDQLRIKDDYEYRTFIEFGVSGVGGSVASATLRLWVINGGNDAGRWYTADNFDEDTIVWNNKPSTGGLLVDHDGVSSGTWLELDVTNAVSGDGTYRFAGVPESTDTVRFSSKEGANPPELVVTWN